MIYTNEWLTKLHTLLSSE